MRALTILTKRAVGSAAAQVADAADLLVCVPGSVVHAAGLRRELLLCEADARVAASVGADGSLAGDALIV